MDRTRLRATELAWNVFAAYGLGWFWVVLAIGVMNALLGQSSILSEMPKLSVTFSWLPMWPEMNTVVAGSVGLSLFMTLVFAPFIEEAIFRLPITFFLGRHPDKVRVIVIVWCGIVFGMAHGHPLKVFVQGFVGLMLGVLYVRNRNSQLSSYLSCVAVHAMYNFTVLLASVVM